MTDDTTPTKTTLKRATSRRIKPRPQSPSHGEISERAYYIHLEEHQTDPVTNWLRAERELTAI